MCVYVKVVCVLVLQKPLHQTVSEILSTAKGTTFFVLTEAGEHGPAGMEKVGRSVETAGTGCSCLERLAATSTALGLIDQTTVTSCRRC